MTPLGRSHIILSFTSRGKVKRYLAIQDLPVTSWILRTETKQVEFKL